VIRWLRPRELSDQVNMMVVAERTIAFTPTGGVMGVSGSGATAEE